MSVFSLKQDGKESEIAEVSGLISQLGPVYAIPLKSAPFSTRRITAEFSQAGVPMEVGVHSDAIAENVAATVSDQLTAASAVRDAVIFTELERVKAQTELLTAQRELRDAQAALNPPANREASEATASIQADTALLNARLAQLNAARALAEARRIAEMP